MTDSWLRGVHSAPNIQGDPAVYDIENRALDPAQHLLRTMRDAHDWTGAIAVDLGAGTSFWVPHLAKDATHVFSVEPHGASRRIGMAQLAQAGILNASVMAGSAEQTMLAAHSVDVVHARFAYFWGPGCEPGLKELERIIAPGGTACIIDNDLEEGTFAQWLRALPSAYQRDQEVLDAFWTSHGFETHKVRSCWRFETRTDFERVVRLEFADAAPDIIASHEGLEVDYAFRIYIKHYTGR